MKNNKIRGKKVIPLFASLALLAGPVLTVTACDHDISRYPASLPNNEQNRILFDFVGVNFNVDAKSQFSAAYSQGMDLIKQNIEGIMAEQEFYNFFKQLGIKDTQFSEIYNNIKDNLGLNLLANDYFSALNSQQNFDDTVYKNHLIFQTDSWHQAGTTEFNYENVPFYIRKNAKTGVSNNPNSIFKVDPTGTSGIYKDLDNQDYTNQIIEVAKHPDTNYNKDITALTKDNKTWDSTSGENLTPPAMVGNDVSTYQKQLYRFKWLLRFRYQQYYVSTILPELNATMFTMANILNSMFKIKNNDGKTDIQININKYANQLQSWSGTFASNFRYVWEYTTSLNNALDINQNWDNGTALPELMSKKNGKIELNSNFLSQLATTDQTVVNTVDPGFGIQGYVNDSSSKPYATQATGNNSAQWLINPAGNIHYWSSNNQGTFAYSLPIYFIDDIYNLDFNYIDTLSPNSTSSAQLIDTNNDPIMSNYLSQWTSSANSSSSSSNFSQYLSMKNNAPSYGTPEYQQIQTLKWKIFWQMLFSISDQSGSAVNKTTASDNFTTAAKTLYPKYIKKENIYDQDFWNAVNTYYS